ncbi:MAG: GNAT family N-acetyltransferase [Desulfitobacterium hafniense]|nr:GNAT family N-acetyltransferase [Desulfitobacterium hafniense]
MKIRRAVTDDMIDFFELRNAEEVRKLAFNTDIIDLKTHKTWFTNQLNDPKSIMLVGEDRNTMVGQVRFTCLEGNSAEIHTAIFPEFFGQGSGQKIIRMGCQYLFANTTVEEVIAHILMTNTRSKHAFLKAGFGNETIVAFKGTECYRMVLRRKDDGDEPDKNC